MPSLRLTITERAQPKRASGVGPRLFMAACLIAGGGALLLRLI